MKTQRAKSRQRLYILITVFSASFLVSLLWFYFNRGFEPILAALGSIAALAGVITIRQRKWVTAIIILVVTVFVGSTILLVRNLDGWNKITSVTLTMRVTNQAGEAISRAKILLFYEGAPFSQITDSNGVVLFTADSNRVDARLIVESEDYQIYEQVVSLSHSQDINIQLERKDRDNRRVIVRAIDDNDSSPVEGAQVLLVIAGNIYEDSTDSNGLSRFVIEFAETTVDAELQVTTGEYEFSNKTVTLQPDRVQDIRLNPLTEEIVEVTETEAKESSIVTAATQSTSISGSEDGESPIEAVPILPISEEETNNSAENAQKLMSIGMNSPVNAKITAASSDSETGEEDWYRFTATAGETYVVEVFNVASTLALVPRRYNCGDGTRDYFGLRLAIIDPSLNEVSRRCIPSGTGDIHTVEQFTAGVNGDYYIHISSHSPVVEGGYGLRILPKYGQQNSAWDPVTFEPNNHIANAFSILIGWENALQSTIEPRNNTYNTNAPDRDSYRFEAVAGRTYVVELFEVSNTLALKINRYNCGEGTRDHTGLWLGAFDPFGNEVARQCTPVGAGNVHSIVQFTAGNDGIFHILVYPHESTVAGNYNIRVLPKHDEPSASWDSISFEPNNRAANAYQLNLGESNALSSAIEPRSGGYSTNGADTDWYYFAGKAGQTYRIELFDVDNRLKLASARYNCGEGTKDHTGLWLGAFDPFTNEIVRQCTPNGSGNLHSFLEFTASRDGIYYLQVYPHENLLSGEYSLRIVER